MSIGKFSKSQLKQSLLTGIPQIIQAKGSLQKLLKSFVLIVCLIGCLYQIWTFMVVYWKYPVNVDVSNPSSIIPPAFTICEYNGINRLKFCKEFRELCTPNKDFFDFCQRHSVFCLKHATEPKGKMPTVTAQELPQNISDVRSEYKKMGSQHYSFVDHVIYDEKCLTPEPVYVFNVEGLPTNCYAFNTVWRNSSAVLVKAPQRTGIPVKILTEIPALPPSLMNDFYIPVLSFGKHSCKKDSTNEDKAQKQKTIEVSTISYNSDMISDVLSKDSTENPTDENYDHIPSDEAKRSGVLSLDKNGVDTSTLNYKQNIKEMEHDKVLSIAHSSDNFPSHTSIASSEIHPEINSLSSDYAADNASENNGASRLEYYLHYLVASFISVFAFL